MSGYGTDELAGVVAEDILMRDNETERKFLHEKNRDRSSGVYDAYEVVVTTRNGEHKWWLISGAPVYNDEGRVTGSIGIHLDITMQKDLEKNLTEARQHAEETAHAKEVFLANMSHEIRTPMNAIHSLGRQLLKTGLESRQESFVSAINTASDNLLVIINDILDFSKIEAGKMPIEKIGFDLRTLFRQVEAILGPKARSKCLDFVIDIDQNVAPILIGDPYRINQILLNLIGNSIKFTETGKISLMCKVIGTGQSEQEVVVTIEDSGIGMDKKFLENIYQKFSQENANNARKYGGTGLGMAITQQLTTLMKGTLHIESEKNRGTKVKILLRLPIGQANDLPTRAEVHMPMMDGITATKIIRSEISGDITIIALTANALKSELDRCIEAGMNDFVIKPFDETTLIGVLVNNLQ